MPTFNLYAFIGLKYWTTLHYYLVSNKWLDFPVVKGKIKIYSQTGENCRTDNCGVMKGIGLLNSQEQPQTTGSRNYGIHPVITGFSSFLCARWPHLS